MKWYWKVRLYRPDMDYWISQFSTNRVLDEINTIQDFYKELTGCKMLLEGMSETPFPHVAFAKDNFYLMFKETV